MTPDVDSRTREAATGPGAGQDRATRVWFHQNAAVTTIRLFMLVEMITFIIAALVHFGILPAGYDHRNAGIAETVLAVVLAGGLVLSLGRPGSALTAGLWAQGIALAGTLVGIITIAIGVGPRTMPDVAYHVTIVVVLAAGLVIASRARAAGAH